MPNDRIFGDLPAWQTAAAGLEEKCKKALHYLGEKHILSPSNAVTRSMYHDQLNHSRRIPDAEPASK